MPNERGLTLFELLIVLAIIGLFALVATPPISKAINVSRIKTTELELENLDTALGLFASANHNTYPDKLSTLLTEGFLTSAEGLKDQFGVNYNYTQSADKNGYILFSSGSDKKPGTVDDLYSKNSIKPGAE